MYCPKCKAELNCGCKSCMGHSPDKPNKMIISDIVQGIHDGNDWNESCPCCNYTMSIHQWFDEEGRQYDEYKQKEENEH